MSFITKPNSWVAKEDSSNTQLSYALQVNPAPITVSVPSEDPVLASLEFVVTNHTGSALSVESVAFTIQVGSASNCLTPTTAGISTDVSDITNWSVTGPSSPVTSGSASYTLGPATGSSVSLAAGASVVVQIFQIQTNSIPGNSTVNVKEMISSSPPAFTSFLVTTFPSGFYFNGLAALVQSSKSGSSLIPVAQVNTGSTVTLVWNSSVVDTSKFNIYYSNADRGQQTASPSDIGEWTSPPLSSDTVFTVVVTASVQGGQPLTAAMSTGVSVQNPSLVAASITTGTATVTGNATISGTTTANAVTADGVTVNGALTTTSATVTDALQAGSLSVNGNGNVGIDTTTPNYPLSFGANLKNTKIAIWDGGTGSSFGLGVKANQYRFHLNNYQADRYSFMDSPGDNANELVTILGTGNIGIGNPTPATKLDVNGSITTAGYIVVNNASINPAIYSTNTTPGAIGVVSNVASNGDTGFQTNGSIIHNASYTQLSTRTGYRVATSPLTLERELHLSGQAALKSGRTKVKFDESITDLIAEDSEYRILLTPLGQCSGLCVPKKELSGFTVEELNGGSSSIKFDWFIIARTPKSHTDKRAAVMPAALPEIKAQ